MSKKETIEIPVIQPDSITEIKISGAFYKMLTDAYFTMAASIEPEKFENLLKAISTQDGSLIQSEEDKNRALLLDIIVSLIKDAEKAFTDAGLMDKEIVELPNEG